MFRIFQVPPADSMGLAPIWTPNAIIPAMTSPSKICIVIKT